MTVYGDRWERSFLGTRETAANSSVLLNTFHVNTMFACRCSEMIYYTCNMKPARRRSARRTWVSWHVFFIVTTLLQIFLSGFGKLHWHYALRIIWKYKQDKIGRWDDGGEGFPQQTTRTPVEQDMPELMCISKAHSSFFRDSCIRISLKSVDLTCFPLPTPWRHTFRLKSRIRN